ncbi:MAG: deoxyribodipyrimidine photo-lyase [Chloroflexota bacterium]|nr:deoxyribodipyrimidine photo-lyase [Chloroflexota bacterium]
MTVLHWFRRDLRLGDNTALNAALESGQPVVALFIFDAQIYRGERRSPNRMQFLLNGLHAIDAELRARGSRLLVRHGDPLEVLPHVIAETGATALFFNRDYAPYARKRDKAIYERYQENPHPIQVHTFHDLLLHPPTTIMKHDGTPYTVFTPFKRVWMEQPKAPVYTASGRFAALDGIDTPPIPTLTELGMGSSIVVPEAGETAALRRLTRFVDTAIFEYRERRNMLFAHPWTDEPQGTSALSPYLRLGMLSPRQAYHATQAARPHPPPPSPHAERGSRAKRGGGEVSTDAIHGVQTNDAQTDAVKGVRATDSIDIWISELCWREFYVHILYHFPHVLNRSFKAEFDAVEFRHAPDELQRWQAGQTGYPIVDAAMRQMQETGWMHNRARMIVASFLTKDLLIHWREGDLTFMQHLLDGDPAANNGGWQWAAGTGTDAQPYFRIFNPVSQSQQFDPTGDYIRALVPELRDVPTEQIHTPWEMAIPPTGYPAPIVDHKFARQRTLDAFKRAKG